MSQIVLYFFQHNTSVLSLYIDVVLILSNKKSRRQSMIYLLTNSGPQTGFQIFKSTCIVLANGTIITPWTLFPCRPEKLMELMLVWKRHFTTVTSPVVLMLQCNGPTTLNTWSHVTSHTHVIYTYNVYFMGIFFSYFTANNKWYCSNTNHHNHTENVVACIKTVYDIPNFTLHAQWLNYLAICMLPRYIRKYMYMNIYTCVRTYKN